MQRTHTFIEDGDRYQADHLLLPQGYCQVDSTQDASYYGNWLHLDLLKAVTYAEGDLYQITFESPEEVRDWLAGISGLLHIDCGLKNRDHNLARAAAIGLSDLAA